MHLICGALRIWKVKAFFPRGISKLFLECNTGKYDRGGDGLLYRLSELLVFSLVVDYIYF